MLFLFLSNQKIARKKPIAKLLTERLSEVNAFNYEQIDGTAENMSSFILSAASLSFTSERKAVLLDSPFFLKDKKVTFENKTQEDSVISLLKNQSDDIDIILSLDSGDFVRDSEISKLVLANAKITEIVENKNLNWTARIINRFKERGVVIDYNAAQELANRINGDLDKYVNEVNKLSLYSDHITIVDVIALVSKPLEDNIFAISNALLKGYNMQAFDIYRDLKVANVEPVIIISMLGNQFRFVFDVKLLSDNRLDNASIAKKLHVSDIRVKIAINNARTYTYDKILMVLSQLSDLDYKIKSGQVDRFYAFELFLINYQ